MQIGCIVVQYVCIVKETDMNIQNSNSITINQAEIMMIFQWFSVNAQEVDITEKDIEFLHKIKTLLPSEYDGMFERYFERFKQNGY